MQMGGKNAAIVFEDADLKKCIATLIKCADMSLCSLHKSISVSGVASGVRVQ